MKKLLVMAAMVLSSVGAFAQYSAGDITIQPKVGLNVSSVTEDEAGYKAGFVGGVEGEYHVSPMVGISAGLLYSMQGASVKDAEGDPKLEMNYVNIPILVNAYVAKGLALKAGIQPAFNVSNKVKVDGISIDYDKYAPEGAEIKTFDFSIPVGISYEYMNVCLDARYNIGVSTIADGDAGRNSVFQITSGHKFKL